MIVPPLSGGDFAIDQVRSVTKRLTSSNRRIPFEKGTPVIVSALGAIRHPRLQGRSGTVTGRSHRYASTWMVRFDGNMKAQAIHEDYIERAGSPVERT